MTGLHVAEPQPPWLSLQHTPPSLGISDTPADAADEAAGILVEVAAALADVLVVLVELADSAGLLYIELPLIIQEMFSILIYTHVGGLIHILMPVKANE